jgi:hypothetical protein
MDAPEDGADVDVVVAVAVDVGVCNADVGTEAKSECGKPSRLMVLVVGLELESEEVVDARVA